MLTRPYPPLMSATIQHTTTDTDDKEVELVKKTQRRIANLSHSQAEPTKSTKYGGRHHLQQGCRAQHLRRDAKCIEVLTNDALSQYADNFHGLVCITEVTPELQTCNPPTAKSPNNNLIKSEEGARTHGTLGCD